MENSLRATHEFVQTWVIRPRCAVAATRFLFRFATCLLLLTLLVVVGASTTSAQQNIGISKVELTGSRAVVFNTKNQCELIDIPDAPARAFRDSMGTIHLVSSHYIMRQSLGPTLESVKHNCDVAYNSRHDPNPAHFDDNTWLDSFYSIDGKNIVALGHMEYHGWEHPGECSEQGSYSASCWYNVDTYNLSTDGGYHFGSFQPPANYMVGLPFPYIVNSGPEGYSVDTNVIKVGDWYYAFASGWSWPNGCYAHSGCFVPGGASPIRTSDITDPTAWRGWNGMNFGVTFVDPYLGQVANPLQHIFTPIANVLYVNAINFHPASNRFVATLIDPFNQAYGPLGIYLSTSSDLLHWTQPVLVVTVAQLLAKEPPGNWSYAYASLLDPDSTDPNFSTIGDTPYLYYVRSDENDCCYVRVLFRQKIKISWSASESGN